MTRNGALAGIVVGAGTVIAWKLIAVDQMGSGLYEMVPGFIAATVAIVLISKPDREPPEELQVRHQQVRASLHEYGYCCRPGPAPPCAPADRPCTTPLRRRSR